MNDWIKTLEEKPVNNNANIEVMFNDGIIKRGITSIVGASSDFLLIENDNTLWRICGAEPTFWRYY